jgi:alanyl-tRNA synthetase
VNTSFTANVAKAFINTYKEEYKNLAELETVICGELEKEENKFRKTLEHGIKQFEKVAHQNISGVDAFDLLQTYGFPIELTEELAKEKNISVDLEEFAKLKKEHAESSRTAAQGKFKGGLGGDGEMETKYHTATHMLHEALRQVLGEHVQQKGSNITTERLRFDFSHDTKMTDEEKKRVEDLINAQIEAKLPVIREEVSMDEARARGAIGLFGDKYGDVVSIYRIGEGTKRGDKNLFSMEFCGGPHVNSTGDLAVGGIHALGSNQGRDLNSTGPFRILKEEAVSTGVRRIKAVLE